MEGEVRGPDKGRVRGVEPNGTSVKQSQLCEASVRCSEGLVGFNIVPRVLRTTSICMLTDTEEWSSPVLEAARRLTERCTSPRAHCFRWAPYSICTDALRLTLEFISSRVGSQRRAFSGFTGSLKDEKQCISFCQLQSPLFISEQPGAQTWRYPSP